MGEQGAQFTLDPDAVAKFAHLLEDEGIMRAGYHALSEADNENHPTETGPLV
ncbi:hypothetical protein ACIGXM_34375 [Kitasatospora sp. NPDC052896]|uniref:hypothetical protein n=1 Tax=Kitasatospora sp. NPDC052896 TaxID=3364061 RepID=UPI0037C94BD8